jgi:hypothetical protein
MNGVMPVVARPRWPWLPGSMSRSSRNSSAIHPAITSGTYITVLPEVARAAAEATAALLPTHATGTREPARSPHPGKPDTDIKKDLGETPAQDGAAVGDAVTLAEVGRQVFAAASVVADHHPLAAAVADDDALAHDHGRTHPRRSCWLIRFATPCLPTLGVLQVVREATVTSESSLRGINA